jgi:hypothetical protein
MTQDSTKGGFDGLSTEKLAAYADMDDLVIRSPRGNIASRLVFTAVFFFDQGGSVDKRVVVHDALIDYAERFRDKLTHHQFPGQTSAPKQIDWPLLRVEGEKRVRALAPSEPLDTAVFGAPFTVQHGGVGLFGGSITASAPDELMPVDLSFMEISLAPSVASQDGFRDVIGLVLDLASKVGPLHGMAGFGVQFDRIYESSSARAYTFPFTRRFPGTHCGLNSNFVVECQDAGNSQIFSVNWLTVIGDEALKSVGGPVKLEETLGETCSLHRYAGGAVIQAGEFPQLGDINRGLVLDDYRRVAAALRPIRFEDYRVGLFDVEEPLDSLDETYRWVRRFD